MRRVRTAICTGRAVLVVSLLVALVAGIGSPAAEAQSRSPLVRLPLPSYDGTLTPYTFEVGYPLMTLVYDTLLWRDADGLPQPWLARSVKRSAGGRQLTIQLRKGVRWHDGRPLTAADVAFTFNYFASRFHPRFTPQLGDVQRVRAVARLTLAVDLLRPSLGFDDQPLADLPILPRHLWQGLAPGRLAPPGLPIGSGPYRLLEGRRRIGYRFGANRSYFKGRPRVGRIRVPIIRDESRTYTALRRRKVDMLPITLPRGQAAELGAAPEINVQRGPLYSGTALVFNLRRPPFDRVAARRAVSGALNVRRILRNAGTGVLADRGLIHPASRWAPRQPFASTIGPVGGGPLAGLRLPAIRVLASAKDPIRLEAGRQVVLALRRAGARATLVGLLPRRLGRAIGEDGSRPDFDMAIVSTSPLASYDPDFLAGPFGSGPNDIPLNESGYRSAAFGALATRVATAPDREARRRAVAAELRLLAKDLPSIPLFFSEGAFAYRPGAYDGWVFVNGVGILDKRSFLPGQARTATRSQDEEDDGGAGGEGRLLGVLGVVSLVGFGVPFVLALVGLVARRRASRNRG